MLAESDEVARIRAGLSAKLAFGFAAGRAAIAFAVLSWQTILSSRQRNARVAVRSSTTPCKSCFHSVRPVAQCGDSQESPALRSILGWVGFPLSDFRSDVLRVRKCDWWMRYGYRN